MAQLSDVVLTIRFDEQQIEDLVQRISQAVGPQISKEQLDEAMARTVESTLRSVRELVEAGLL